MTQPNGRPPSTVVYLAQQSDPDTVTDFWAELITGELTMDAGFHVYRAQEAWRTADGRPDARVETVNRVALLASDVLVALVPSSPTGLELGLAIEAALAHSMPTVVVTNSLAVRDSLTGRPGVWLTKDVDDAVPLIIRARRESPLTQVKMDVDILAPNLATLVAEVTP